MLYSAKPEWKKWLEVAACFIEYKDKILLLKRPSSHKFADTWIEPGWKVDTWENPEDAMIREIFEESWVIIQKWQAKNLWKKYFYFDETHISITFFHCTFQDKPNIILTAKEASEYKWVSIDEALKMNLIDDLDEILNIFFIQK